MSRKSRAHNLYLTIATGTGSTVFHAFDQDHKSLCGKIMMLRVDPKACETASGKEIYRKGQDCKMCFRKAGLLKAEGEVR